MSPVVYAQSALYFQGDKETGIYVKVEGKMMERLSRNFIIVPGLEPGVANFELLFEQNAYPSQHYKIQIPEDGIRGFIITKVDDKNFALFDIQSNGYIGNNNDQDEAFLQLTKRDEPIFASAGKKKSQSDDWIEEIEQGEDNYRSKVEKEDTEEKEKPNRFMEEIDLNNNQPKERKKKSKEDKTILVEDKLFKTKDNGEVKDGTTRSKSAEETTTAPVVVSCDEAMSAPQFDSYAQSFNGSGDDESKLKYFKKTYKQKCLKTEQIGFLASLMKGQAVRYEMVQLAYPRVTDKDNYDILEKLFSTDFLKKKFNDMIK